MSLRNASDLTLRKTHQTKYFDHVRLRGLAVSGAIGKVLVNKDFVDIVNGGILQFDNGGNVVGADTTPLSVIITSDNASIINTSTATITITFNRAINNTTFTANDLVVSGGTISSFTHASSTTTTCVFTPTSGSSGTATIGLPANTVSTLEGISNESAGISLIVTIPPTLTVTLSTNTPTITLADRATINIRFNMPIVTSDLSLGDFIIFPPIPALSSLTIISSTEAFCVFTPIDTITYGTMMFTIRSAAVRLLSDNTKTNTASNALTITTNPVILTAAYPGAPSSIQWWRNGSQIPGATGNTYTATSIGTYYNTGDGTTGPYTSPTTVLPTP